mmetsp:Transcript_4661/g.4348  ORF Transcript_4661/g.4348 Transcript_4661/m.4348 type:complete len:81 (-) Transcript_4661:55-297(-)|eukprot:CAMPEP_0197002150 /NCGR_PEP_ID=MMETSP1380-20130617/6706_1 /TAXON_ID=5936 /ORGANISM="Euplotes crassus, Strain CT5" /LENGTH=80 /DNA_ID=CAMNT_0042420151 /DNA_START=12 /DNA_END=254 /DNA_ORIENTATION=+
MSKPKSISSTEADLLFAKILSKKNKALGITKATAVAGRMEFPEFMVALQEIAVKIYPKMDKEEAFLTILQDKILPLGKGA